MSILPKLFLSEKELISLINDDDSGFELDDNELVTDLESDLNGENFQIEYSVKL
jgi:hypothetical protein